MHVQTLLAMTTLVTVLMAGGGARAVAAGANYQPLVGQEGKDVIWVPNPAAMVEKMLDMAAVTAQDFVIDLGSGDGRNVIGAAGRGARARGVEFNPELVEHSRRRAAAAGVGGRVEFVEGDMFAADVSEASVLALFLLPDNLRKLMPKFVDMKPGSRIVSNTYEIPGWPSDKSCAATARRFVLCFSMWCRQKWRASGARSMAISPSNRITSVYPAAMSTTASRCQSKTRA